MNVKNFTASPDDDDLLVSSFTFIAPSAVVDIHAHYCYHMCASLNKPFDCVVNGNSLKGTWGIIVNQHMPHLCDSPTSTKLIHFIDPDSIWGRTVKKMLNEKPYMEMSELMHPGEFINILPDSFMLMPASVLRPHVAAFIKKLFMPFTIDLALERDERINKAIIFVDAHLHDKLRLEDLADHINLSPDRTRHLFTKEVGVPFS
jgi:hypothetical protein